MALEELTAVPAYCLAVFVLLKVVQEDMGVEGSRLLLKTGGKSGEFRAGS